MFVIVGEPLGNWIETLLIFCRPQTEMAVFFRVPEALTRI